MADGIVVVEATEVASCLDRYHPRGDGRGEAGAVVLTGAGCSVTGGVPTAVRMAEQIIVRLANSARRRDWYSSANAQSALDYLRSRGTVPSGTSLPTAFPALFRDVFRDQKEQRAVIREFTGKARLNWAHVCLAELVARGYVHTILTTNFDDLALKGLARAGITPLIADGVEELVRVDGNPRFAQLVYLHGTQHSYRMRNSASDVARVEKLAGGAPEELFRESSALLVVGYGGRDRGVMRALQKAAVAKPGGKAVFWVMHEKNPDLLSPLARDFLRACGGRLILGQDADVFFDDLALGLGIAPGDLAAGLERESRELAESAAPAIHVALAAHRDDRAVAARLVRSRRPSTASRLRVLRGKLLSNDHRVRRRAQRGEWPAISRLSTAEAWSVTEAVCRSVFRAPEHHDEAILRRTLAIVRTVIRRKGLVPDQRAELLLQQGWIELTLGRLETNPQLMRQAVKGFQASLKISCRRRQALSPLMKASALHALGSAHLELGQQLASVKHLRQAGQAFKRGSSESLFRYTPRAWAAMRYGSARASQTLALLVPQTSRFGDALRHLGESLRVWNKESSSEAWARVVWTKGEVALAWAELGSGGQRAARIATRCFGEVLRADVLAPSEVRIVRRRIAYAGHVLERSAG